MSHSETSRPDDSPSNTMLTSGVLTSPADGLLARAIALTLHAPPCERAEVFFQHVREIERFMVEHHEARPWTCTVFVGTDGSRIFRGGVGHSLVIDRAGRLWRARSLEDFDTTYQLTATSCEIESLTPRYEQMRQYASEF